MSYIAEDEGMMKKVIAFIKNLRRENKENAKGALSASPDPKLEKEAQELYGIYNSADITEEELSAIVGEARAQVYGKK